MFKRLIATGFAVSLGMAAAPIMAQDAPAEEATPATDEAAAPTENSMNRVYAQMNYNAAEDLENLWYLDLSSGGRVAIRLMPDWAPEHVERIKTLTRQGFYNGVIFHRVIDGFMAQTGDPTGTGQGGSELPNLTKEFNRLPHVRGTVSMARANDENSANSQFFIVFYPRFALDMKYTNFGRVIQGMAIVDAIDRGEPPQNPDLVIQASIASDNIAAPAPQPVATPAPVADTADLVDNTQLE